MIFSRADVTRFWLSLTSPSHGIGSGATERLELSRQPRLTSFILSVTSDNINDPHDASKHLEARVER